MTARQTHSGESLRVARTFDCSRDEVFHAWTDPQEIVQWWPPEGFTDPSAELQLREGGNFRIGMTSPEGTRFFAVGTFRDVDAPNRLVCTWSWEGWQPSGDEKLGETLLTVEFHERGGSTEVVLTHEGFPSQKLAGEHQQGWEGCLSRVGTVVATTSR